MDIVDPAIEPLRLQSLSGLVIARPEAVTDPADDCPIARLRSEVETLKTQVRSIEALLEELEGEPPRDD